MILLHRCGCSWRLLLVQSGRVCLTLTDLQEILKLGGVEANLQCSPAVLSVPILQPCLRSEQLMVSHPFRPLSKLASKHSYNLLQPQVQVDGEVEPGGLAPLPRHAAQAGDPGGG